MMGIYQHFGRTSSFRFQNRGGTDSHVGDYEDLTVFWGVIPYNLIDIYRRFGVICWLNLLGEEEEDFTV
jgi:hypothetical protein